MHKQNKTNLSPCLNNMYNELELLYNLNNMLCVMVSVNVICA